MKWARIGKQKARIKLAAAAIQRHARQVLNEFKPDDECEAFNAATDIARLALQIHEECERLKK